MKLNHLFAIAAAGSFALVACDKQSADLDKKAADATAAVDKKMDEVKDAAKDKAADASAKIDKVVQDTKDAGAKAVDATKDAAATAADATKDAAAKAADAVKDAVPPLPGAPK